MSFTYSTISNSAMIQRSDGAFIPPDAGNTDYRMYLAWVAEGNVAQNSLTLAQAQQQQIQTLFSSYQSACQVPVSYTSQGGITKTYQADANSVNNLSWMLAAFAKTQAVPTGFYWVAADNTQVPFSYIDMQNLATAFGIQGAAAFVQYQSRKAQVNSAVSIAAVQAITW